MSNVANIPSSQNAAEAQKSEQRPDVALDRAAIVSELAEVGMSEIQVPLRILSTDGSLMQIQGVAHAFVSLDRAEARGIHMSRIYKTLQENLPRELLSQELLQNCVQQFLRAHQDLSRRASLQLDFNWSLQRASLKSEQKAWRTYPVSLKAEFDGKNFSFFVEVRVAYSSTCPASGALARQLVQEEFAKNFAEVPLDFEKIKAWLGREEGMIATPHAQRSHAQVRVELIPGQASPVLDVALQLINGIEDVLQTPVQGFVKRADEQEFALRNGRNLMFCEDAARRVQKFLQGSEFVKSFSGEFRHVESLHPHDAVARIASKS
jgi:GTP cyclohydrolase I